MNTTNGKISSGNFVDYTVERASSPSMPHFAKLEGHQ